jgi:serine phosphatase RsbU (regulator of sigma subunit)
MLARLPESDEVAMAARYITAAERDQVGGDWYDVVVMPTGSITLAVGAVVGHDIAAATMMGQLRNVLRTLVWERREPPSAVVQRLDSAMRDLGLDTTATAILMNVDEPMAGEPDSVATLRWTSAGHPAPILIRGDGTAAILDDATDIMLGVRPDAVRREHTRPVPPGATLLLYTDGLIESRSQAAEDGQRRLLDAVGTHHDLEPNDLLDALIADLADDRPSDDIVVLAVRFGDEPLPTRPR